MTKIFTKILNMYQRIISTPRRVGGLYYFTAVGVVVRVLVGVTLITKGPPVQIFLGGMIFVPQVIIF